MRLLRLLRLVRSAAFMHSLARGAAKRNSTDWDYFVLRAESYQNDAFDYAKSPLQRNRIGRAINRYLAKYDAIHNQPCPSILSRI